MGVCEEMPEISAFTKLDASWPGKTSQTFRDAFMINTSRAILLEKRRQVSQASKLQKAYSASKSDMIASSPR
jgi:hypothetical protein